MTSFISVFCLIVITVFVHPGNCGAVPSSSLQQDHPASNVRSQRSLGSLGRPLGRKHKKRQKPKTSSKKNQKVKRKLKKSKKRQERRSKAADKISAKVVQKNSVARAKGRQSEFNGTFQHCDYLDLTEVGYRQTSDFNCAPGDKFLFKVCNQKILGWVTPTGSYSFVIVCWINILIRVFAVSKSLNFGRL